MIEGLKPYPEYKDSGVPWLDKVPSEWKVRRGKWLFQNPKELNTDRANKNVLSLTLRGVVNNDPDNPEGLVPKDYATYQLFRKSDLVFKLIDLENLRTSRVGLVHEDGIMSSAYIRLTAHNAENMRFFFHQYFDLYQRGIYNQLGAGVRSTLGANDLLDVSILLPSPHGQDAIVRFLDHANGRIERVIRAKKKLIALLNEQKQAIIHRAVTRGLDPAVPLKPSGIPWLGDIPRHWEVRRNSWLFDERNERGRPGLPILVVSLRTGVTEGAERGENGREKRLIADLSAYKFANEGDIAYNMMRMWQGAVGVVPKPGLVSPAYVVARPREGVLSAYYELLFRTDSCKNEINRNSTGIVSDRNRLYWDQFKRLYLPLPPSNEQREILKFIEIKTANLNVAITRMESDVNLLREYKIRLIADVVTGKLDVREAAAKLPTQAAEPEAISAEDEPDDETDDDV